jgi:ferredoxin
LTLAVSAAFALGFASERFPDAISFLTRLSPVLSLLGALSARAWLGWAMLLGVPLLVLSFFKGRVFCWRICPVGFVTETAGRLNPRGKTLLRRIPVLNKTVFMVIAVTAACGYPLFIWLDPLCMFNGFFAALRTPFTVASATTGIAFVTVLAISVLVPNVWCHRLCPLGGMQESMSLMAGMLRRGKTGEEAPGAMKPAMARRTLLAAVLSAVAGIAAKRAFGPNGRKVLRPPGADLERINALCARCGNCMQACPYQLIKPDVGGSGIDGLFTPVLKFRSSDPSQEQYCFHDCVKCSQVCPTGALRPITAEEKRKLPIGIAVINRKKCIAWEKNEYCAVCDEYCPFKAIRLVKRGDVMCPIVEDDLCRGCGACESACPADPIAITVK